MLEGLMQHDHPLTLQHVLDRMRTLYADSEVVTVRDDGRSARDLRRGRRARRPAGAPACASLGVEPGDRVATFAWNTQEHLEAYLAVPCMGAVLHTLNIRLFAEQLEYIVNHAEDRVVLVDPALAPVFAELLPRLRRPCEHVVVMGAERVDALPGRDRRYEELLAAQEPGFDWPALDDRMAAGPLLHERHHRQPEGRPVLAPLERPARAGRSAWPISMGLRTEDRVLPVVPMFHANAWGLPYASALVGADLVLPGRYLQAEPLADLIASERVTLARRRARRSGWTSCATPTSTAPTCRACARVACGGSAVPLSLMRDVRGAPRRADRPGLGHDGDQPAGLHRVPAARRRGRGALAPPRDRRPARCRSSRRASSAPTATEQPLGRRVDRRARGARPVDLRASTTATRPARRSSTTAGCAPATSPSIDATRLHPDQRPRQGRHQVRRRVDLLRRPRGGADGPPGRRRGGGDRQAGRALVRAPAGLRRAWPEGRRRPAPRSCAAHLRDRVAKWWIPDEFAFIDEVPKTSVGKFDKKVLRRALEEGRARGPPRARREPRSPVGPRLSPSSGLAARGPARRW